MTAILLDLYKQNFYKLYGTHCQEIYRAPARVNLMGEHTDYNKGFVLPVAINKEIYCLTSKRNDKTIQVYAEGLSNEPTSWSVDLNATINHDKQQVWTDYLRGVSQQFLKAGHVMQGLDIYIAGNIPIGAGLSSSAALCMVFAYALNSLNELSLNPEDLALLSQKAENEFVGCQCGIMDQLIIAEGQQDRALLIDCQDLSYQAIPLPKDLRLTIIDSHVPHQHSVGGYNSRREQCELAAKALGYSSLREASLEDLNKLQTKPVEYKRAKHVVSENLRVLKMTEALKDNNLKALSELMWDSHQSMRNDFEISTPEIDYLAKIINDLLNGNGGVRMTGGGFGGSLVALAPKEFSKRIEEVVIDNYFRQTGLQATVYHCESNSGVSSV